METINKKTKHTLQKAYKIKIILPEGVTDLLEIFTQKAATINVKFH
jgi:hypothetical protein